MSLLARRLRELSIKRINREAMEVHHVVPSHFGAHWPIVESKRLANPEEMNIRSFERLCWMVARMPQVGLHIGQVNKKHLEQILTVSVCGEEEDWRRRATIEMRRLRNHLHKMNLRHKRADREDDEPFANSERTAALVTRDDGLPSYKSITTMPNFLGPIDMATGMVIEMRAPRDETGQELLPFADGPKLYPSFLLDLSTLERYNLALPVQVFEQAAIIAHIPESFPDSHRVVVIGRLKALDLRMKPSAIRPFMELKKAFEKNLDIDMVNLVQVLCIAHYRIASSGIYAFAYRQMEKLGLLDVLDYGFDWMMHVRGSQIMRAVAPVAPLAEKRTQTLKITLGSRSVL